MKQSQSTPSESLFWMPIQKAYESSVILDADGTAARIIEGWASVDDGKPDLEGETVDINGIDDSFFLKDKIVKGKTVKMGAINWNHSDEPEHHLGRPIEARKGDGFYYLKARLDKGGKADSVWEKLTKNAPEEHGYGFSLQGYTKERHPHDPKRVAKSFVQKISVTPQDINGSTWMDAMRKGVIDPRNIVLALGQEEDSVMSQKAADTLAKGADKVLGKQDTVKGASLLAKGLRLLGIDLDADVEDVVRSSQQALKKGADGGNDKDDDKDEDDDMNKGGCAHSGMKGAHCSDCGSKLAKGVKSVLQTMAEDPETAEALDAIPMFKQLAKGVSRSVGSILESNSAVIEPMAKAMAVHLQHQEETVATLKSVQEMQTKIVDAQATLQKGITDLQTLLAGAGKTAAAEPIRKSADGTVIPAEDKKVEQVLRKAVDDGPGGAKIFRGVDAPTKSLIMGNLQKAVTSGVLAQDVGGAMMTDLQNNRPVVMLPKYGLDLLKQASN